MKELSAIVGESRAVQALRARIIKAGPDTIPVLIQGPTGAGKELVAQALHACSNRTGRLVSFNVCAIADSMFEDALFGHTRGAFTGAAQSMLGFLREAHHGTLFMDEVSGLPLSLQAKLLRAMDSGQFRPVGAAVDAHSDFRLIAATNQPLELLALAGQFRMDLLYRIEGLRIDVPSLAARLEDLPLLVRHFLTQAHRDACTVTDALVAALAEYDWPGNVRELKHFVLGVAVSGALTPGRVREALAPRRTVGGTTDAAAVERQQLVMHLAGRGWDTAAVAADLGIHRTTLYRRMEGLSIPRRGRPPREGLERTG